ncbi:MAG: hypothetical protein KKA62_05755 [Nanoarchaeota archaeon]|nr:hypothetical protein [Nanoarchaeota archaeon]MBU1644083.1 hypothetical protein [Nanoarchaeota archaeon]MBU1977429.1 hypothetical protein [Nanoarchaeota archaeon]
MGSFKSLALGVSLTFASLGCDGLSEGVPVYGNCSRSIEDITADLLLLQEENRCVTSENLIGCFEKKNPFVLYENTTIQDFVSCSADFFEKDLAEKGLDYLKKEEAVLFFVPKEEIKDYCNGIACTKGNKFEIVVDNTHTPPKFHTILNHELGHTQDEGKEEFLSIYHEKYSIIKNYQLTKKYGSFLIGNFFEDLSVDEGSNLTSYENMYQKSFLLIPAILIESGGDLDRAYDEIAHSDILLLNTRLKKAQKNFSGNPRDRYYQSWDKLIHLEGFKKDLQKHLSETETEEFISYLDLKNKKMYISNFEDEHPVKKELSILSKEYLANKNFTNPFFKAQVVLSLEKEILEPFLAVKDDGYESNDQKYESSKAIVELFQDVIPCRKYLEGTDKFDPFFCFNWSRDPLSVQLMGYEMLMLSSTVTDDEELKKKRMKVAAEHTIDYVEKFYPGADFYAGKFEALKVEIDNVDNLPFNWAQRTNDLLPFLAVTVAENHFTSGDDISDNITKLYLTAALGVECKKKYYPLSRESLSSYKACLEYQERADYLLNKWY